MIPSELLQRDQWVGWAYRTRKGKPTKVPLSPHGGLASSTDPATWGSYREALGIVGSQGVGYVFADTDPYTGIDMDRCVSATGRVHDAALRIVDDLNGWAEFSPSGTGIHVIVRGRLKRGRHTLRTPWRNELAVYDRGRYFSMLGTGRGEIREAQTELNALIALYFPEPDAPPRAPTRPLCPDDAAVVDRIRADDRMARLWSGITADHESDHSAADLALVAHLAFLTGSDAGRMDALFRASGLMREKWNERRGEGTYGSVTIDKALGGG